MNNLNNIFHILRSERIFWILSDFIRLTKKPTQQLALWRDYINTVCGASFIRDIRNENVHSDVIIISLSNKPYQLKIESMLAIGLKLNGRPAVPLIKSRKDRWAIRYFKAYGINKFLYWEEERIPNAKLEEIRIQGEEFCHAMQQNPSLESIKSWMYRGSAVGVHLLSTLFRKKRTSNLGNLSNELTKWIQKKIPEVLKTILLAESLITRENPKLMYVMEANYVMNGPICDVAVSKGIDLIQAVQRDRDDALVCRRLNKETRREQASSITRENLRKIMSKEFTLSQWKKLQEILDARYSGTHFLGSRHHPTAKNISREELCKRFNFDPSKKIVVVYSHLLWDSNLFYGEDLFMDFADWFIQTIRAACNNDRVNWLIKLHPSNSWKRDRENASEELEELRLIKSEISPIESLPDHVNFLHPESDIGTFALRSTIDVAVTVRGTIINELAIFGIPVLTAGTGKAVGLGFTVDSTSKEEYIKRLANIQSVVRLGEQQVEAARKFSYCLFHSRLWLMKSFKCNFTTMPKGSHPLDSNLAIQCDSLDEIRENRDLSKWVEWATRKERVDFLDYEYE